MPNGRPKVFDLIAVLVARPFIIVALAFFSASCGCTVQHNHPTKAMQVTLAQLEQETAGLERFSYLGTDKHFHYFKTNAGKYYKLPEQLWPTASRDEMIYPIEGVERLPDPGEPSFEGYVTVKGGQIVSAPLP